MIRQVRKGTYTKRLTLYVRTKRLLKRRWRWFKQLKRWRKIALIAGPIVGILVLIPLGTYIYYAQDISNETRLMNNNNTGVVLTDQSGQVIYSFGKAEHTSIVPLSQIATVTQNSLIASEDKNFYKEGGFSPSSIIRSMYDDVVSHDATAYGGSTITQQLAKNTLLSDDQTLLRKYQELAIAVAINQEYSKSQILDMYLNSVYFGDGAFGIQEAAQTYFGTTPDKLDLAQSAMLIGVLPSPSDYSPITGDATLAKQRQATVLQRMETNGYITAAQLQAAEAETLTYAPQQSTANQVAPQFVQMVLAELDKKYGEEQVDRSGFQVKTSLSLTMQNEAQTNMNNHLAYIQREGGSDASLVAVDPQNGEIRALIGTSDYSNPDWGQINLAISPRQPGSSFKPIYYTDALSRGLITSSTIFPDEPVDFNGYEPLDADHEFRGNVTVRQALAESLNIPSVEVMQKEGIPNAVAAADKLGITTIGNASQYGLALALGSANVPLTEMTNAYAAFADGGNQYPLTTIDSIQNKFSQTVYTNTSQPKQAVTPQAAYLISSILSDYIAKEPIFGNTLTVPGKNVAVKTGTTNDDRDALTIGYTPTIAIGVWVGNADNSAMNDGGSDMAGPIWKSTIEDVIGSSTPSFAEPNGIVSERVCRSNGLLTTSTNASTTVLAYFLNGTEPTTNCNGTTTSTPTVTPAATTVTQPDTTTTTPTATTSAGSGSGTGTGTTGTGTGTTTGTGTGTGTGTTGTGSGTGTTTSPGTGSGGTGTGTGSGGTTSPND